MVDTYDGEVHRGGRSEDIVRFIEDYATGFERDGIDDFTKKVMRDDGTIMLEHRKFEEYISQGMGIE